MSSIPVSAFSAPHIRRVHQCRKRQQEHLEGSAGSRCGSAVSRSVSASEDSSSSGSISDKVLDELHKTQQNVQSGSQNSSLSPPPKPDLARQHSWSIADTFRKFCWENVVLSTRNMRSQSMNSDSRSVSGPSQQ